MQTITAREIVEAIRALEQASEALTKQPTPNERGELAARCFIATLPFKRALQGVELAVEAA